MKGEIFNVFEKFIIANWGEEAFEEIYEAVLPELETKEPFVGPGTYPDSDLMKIAIHTIQRYKLTMPEALQAFGKFLFPHLTESMPESVEGQEDPKEFLKTVDEIIHVEVRKLHPDAITPKFTYEDPAPNKLIMIYDSPRCLYDLVDGLIAGVSEHFATPIAVSREILPDGEGKTCRFELTFG